MTVSEILENAARGTPPAVDGLVDLVPRPAGVVAAVLAFTGHHVIAADVDRAWVDERLAPWDLSAPFSPSFLGALAERVGSPAGTLDLVLIATRPPTPLHLRQLSQAEAAPFLAGSPHPRREARVWQTRDGAGTVIVARGLADRWELRFDVAEGRQGRGIGRALAGVAPALVPPTDVLFAQVAPGNVVSLRALLGAGYRPIGGEVLFFGPPDRA